MLYIFDDAGAAEQHETQYFEMFGNRGIYHKGWTAVTKHRTPWEAFAQAAGVRRRRLGAVRHHHGLEPGARPRQGESAEAARAAAPVADRGDTLQGAAAWTTGCSRSFNPDTAGRPVLIKGKTQLLFGGMGHLCGELCPQPQEQVPLGHRRDRGAGAGRRGRHHCPGRQHRRLEPVRQGRQAQVLLQLERPASTSTWRRAPRSRRASTRCAWSSPTPVAAWARAAR